MLDTDSGSITHITRAQYEETIDNREGIPVKEAAYRDFLSYTRFVLKNSEINLDHLEFGPANNRAKIYIDLGNLEDATERVLAGLKLQEMIAALLSRREERIEIMIQQFDPSCITEGHVYVHPTIAVDPVSLERVEVRTE